MKNNYIELFGLPASGKSYYTKYILKEYINYNQKYIYARNRILRNMKKIILIIYMIFSSFKIFISAALFIKKLNISLKKKLKMFLYIETTLAIIKLANNAKDNKICIEEGLLQVLWGICYLDFDNSDLIIKEFRILFKEYFTINVLNVKTNIELVKERLLARKNNGGSELEHDINNDDSAIEKAIIIEKKIINEFNNIHFKNVDGE